MVQLLADPAVPHATPSPGSEHGDGPWPASAKQEGAMMTREEHARMRELLNKKRSMMKTPRRGWSMVDYQNDDAASTGTTPVVANAMPSSGPGPRRHAPIPENAPWQPADAAPTPPVEAPQPVERTTQLPRRPKLPTPRRSYSVTDCEPEPTAGQPRPSSRMTLLDLPSELHYLFCDYLDPIDSVCFGLAHSQLYDIHRRKYGTVPLSSRYSGPNTMEWAWRGAGPLVSSNPKEKHSSSSSSSHDNKHQELGSVDRSLVRPRGQVYCRKCGIHRCELHRHLKEWMGEGMEYCEIRETFGKPAGEDRRPHCYMSSPRNPNRCGRHGGRKV